MNNFECIYKTLYICIYNVYTSYMVKHKYKSFKELETLTGWLDNNPVFVTGIFSTPRGIYLVYEVNDG